tara:strand:+ start:183 stop:677 length:495 start_codon:yes stop_codon:yes gene_type:complete
MSTRAAHSSVTTEVNNGGTAINLGTVASDSPITKAVKSSETTSVGPHGSVVSTASADVTGSGPTLNTITPNTDLYDKPPQAVNVSIHKQEGQTIPHTTTGIRAGNFNRFGVAGQTSNFSPAASGVAHTYASDNAASPTRLIPGELTFRTGAKVPTSVDYEAKNG